MRYKTKPNYGDLERMGNLKTAFREKLSGKKAKVKETPAETVKSPKCFIGYGGTGNHLSMNILAHYGKSKWKQFVPRDDAYSTPPCPMLVMRLVTESKDGLLYNMPTQPELGGAYTFSHSCRESMRSYFQTMCSATKLTTDELITKLSLGFKTVEIDNSATVPHAEGVLRVFNLIEEHLGWKKTVLDIVTGDDLYFVGDRGMITSEKSADQLHARKGFREATQQLATFFMYRPEERWLQAPYTQSLFFLFMRMSLTGAFDQVTTYDEFITAIDKLCRLDEFPMTSVSRSTPVNMFGEYDVNISLNRDLVHYRVVRNYWKMLLENIDAVVDKEYENRASLSDGTFGITAFIANVLGSNNYDRPDIKNFRDVISTKYN